MRGGVKGSEGRDAKSRSAEAEADAMRSEASSGELAAVIQTKNKTRQSEDRRRSRIHRSRERREEVRAAPVTSATIARWS